MWSLAKANLDPTCNGILDGREVKKVQDMETETGQHITKNTILTQVRDIGDISNKKLEICQKCKIGNQ